MLSMQKQVLRQCTFMQGRDLFLSSTRESPWGWSFFPCIWIWICFLCPCNTGLWPFICNVTCRTILFLHFYSPLPPLWFALYSLGLHCAAKPPKCPWCFSCSIKSRWLPDNRYNRFHKSGILEDLSSKYKLIMWFKSSWYCTRVHFCLIHWTSQSLLNGFLRVLNHFLFTRLTVRIHVTVVCPWNWWSLT